MYVLVRMLWVAALCLLVLVCWTFVAPGTWAGSTFIIGSKYLLVAGKLGHFWCCGLLALMLSFLQRNHTRPYFNLPQGGLVALTFAFVWELAESSASLPLDFADAGADYLGVQLAAWFVKRT